MRVFILVLSAGLALASKMSQQFFKPDQFENYFKEFLATYNKHYAEEEYIKRLEIFSKNLEVINEKNMGRSSSAYGVTKFSDLTVEEFLNNFTGLTGSEASACKANTQALKKISAPDSFDWRDKNVVTKVKDQGFCKCCWAFGATGNLEGQYAIKHKQLSEFSEQQLVDCDDRSDGCNGTLALDNPFLYWTENGAIFETDYSYEGHEGVCKFDDSKRKVNLAGCTQYTLKDEEQLKDLLYQIGPLTIGVDATSMHNCNDKIIEDCVLNELNHAVLLVGYGSDDDTPFWLIKNSWGETEGDKGYMKIKRGVNACGLMNSTAVSANLA